MSTPGPSFRLAARQDVPAIVRLLADDRLGRTREVVGAGPDDLPAAYWRAFEAIAADPRNLLVSPSWTGRWSARCSSAWAARGELHGGAALVAWDQRDPVLARAGAHKWLTHELILVECLLSTPASGVRLASPAVVIAGDPGLLDGFPRRPPITRAEMDANPLDLHPVERTYDDLKAAARAALRPA